MDTARITDILADPVTLDLVEKQPITQIAYSAADGSPRAVPLGYLLREGKFLFFTIPSSDKVAALHHDPRIALTIDFYPPPCCLLVRGTAELREEDGVPDEYLQASFRTMPEDQHAVFEEQVRALYDSMVRVVVTPTWVRLNDFQRTAPRAVERLVQAKQGGSA
jgi:pyridoxamine 5'-phosphate oxidase-like protein